MPMPIRTSPSPCRVTGDGGWRARWWRIFGSICVAIGIANAFIPLLPTTVFLIIGAWAWGKGAPEWRQRLLDHPRYGPPLRLWLEHRAISRRGKRMCVLGLAVSGLLSSWLLDFAILPTTALLGFLTLLGTWIATRREPTSDARVPTPPIAREEAGQG